MNLALIASLLLFFILPASALIPASNISDNKSYIAEPNTNTSFIPENHEVFISEITPQTTATMTPLQPITTLTPSSCCSSGSSGGGSGSGGVISTENFSNIVKYETHEGTLIAGQPVSFKFNLSVYEVILIGKENEDVTVRVELLKDMPRKATVKPQGEVISYLNVVTSSSKRLKEAVIRFKINQSSNLFKWNGSTWINLVDSPINEVCQETLVYYYGADHNKVSCTIQLIPSGEIIGFKEYYKDDLNNISYNYQIKTDNLSSFAIISSASATPTTTIQFLETAPAKITNTTIPTAVPKQSSGFGVGLVLVAFLINRYR